MTKSQKSLILIVVLVVILLNSVFVSAIKGSMGNAKMILYPEVNGWTTTTIEKTILVKNVNDIPIDITLETDASGAEFIEIIDKSFTLEPNTEKKAQFLVKVKKEGRYDGRINVFFSPGEEEGPGVVLSSTIVVIAAKDQDYQEFKDEEENEDADDEEDDGNILTGGSAGVNDSNPSRGLLYLTLSTLILLIVLGYLLSTLNKKRNKLNAKKRNKKK